MKHKPNDTVHNLRPVTPYTILKAKLNILQGLAKDQGLSKELKNVVEECINLVEPLESYLLQSTSPPSKELNVLEKETNNLDWDIAFSDLETDLHLEKEMLSGALEGQFLKFITSISKAKRVLEVGSFTGYASLAMAEALPEDGEVIACEYDQFTAEFAKSQIVGSEHGKKIKILVGDAEVTLNKLIDDKETFDLVFIDADKEGYRTYYSLIMDSELLNKSGIICVDNTLYMGQAYKTGYTTANGEAIKAFNKLVSDDERVHQVMVPLRDGVTLIRRLA